MISVRNLRKVYKLKGKGGKNNVVALNGINIDFPDKGLVFLLGKSGSGKSTLLNTIGGLDTFDEGEIIIKGKSSKDFKQSDFDSYRNTFIGFIFQEYNILEEFSVGKNLALALELQGKKASKARVNELLKEVDLAGYYKRKPNQLSGGQKQRVAIARALIKDPEIIMADEPTGALDSNTGKQVMDTLKKLSREKLVIIVSHDREFAEIYGDRIIELKDGNIIRDEVKTEVEAVKSPSGVSFIDNKIVHIKKGQKINKDDLIAINRMIVNNIGKNDTIISFDEKSNEEVKKSAFITDEGNREVFKTTQKEDIKQEYHNPKDFKMIRSKLKFKDSFKMGASSLRHKPIRLLFTILLAVVALGMFGVVDTMSSFNRADSVYATIEEFDVQTLVVNKRANYYDNKTYPISDELFNQFQNANKNYDLHKVICNGESFNIKGESYISSGYDNNTIRCERVSGIMAIDENIKKELKLELIKGKLPLNSSEICISSNMLDTIVQIYTNISSFEELEGKEIQINNSGNYSTYIIVGVLKDNTNIEQYKNLDGSSSSLNKNSNKYEELAIIMNYSLVNMCYVNQETFDDAIENYTFNNWDAYRPYIKGKEYNGGYYSTQFNSVTNIGSSYDVAYLKEGVSLENLGKNQAVISKGILTTNLQIDESEINDKIDAGLIVSFSTGYDENNHAFDLEIVGYDDYTSNVVVNDEFYNIWLKGATSVLTMLKGSSEDKSIIKYFENYNDNAFIYSVQCQATPILDNFGELVENMAKILLYVGIGLAVFAGLMLMNFISTSITYKKREIGVLRAIGARGKDVFSIFFAESFIICLINFVLSTIATIAICNLINKSLISQAGISLTLMIFGVRQVILLFAVSLIVAFISTFLPVYKFAKKNPIDSINNR